MSFERNELKTRLHTLETQQATTVASLENEWAEKLENSSREFRSTMRQLQDEFDEKLFERTATLTKEKSQLEQDMEEKRTVTMREHELTMNRLREELVSVREESVTQQQKYQQEHEELVKELEKVKEEQQQQGLQGGRGGENSEELEMLKQEKESLVEKMKDIESRYVMARDRSERLEVDYEEAQEEIQHLKKTIQELESSKASGGEGIDQEKINVLMQTIYGSMVNVFPNSVDDSDDEEQVQHYTAPDVLKRCRKVLKQVSNPLPFLC
jgi:chromosome segregation ATPase